MRILGVDPGTWRMGVGIIDAKGNSCRLIHLETLAMRPGTPISQRLFKIHNGLLEIIRIFKPGVLALENIFYGKDIKAMIRIGEARACAMLAASMNGVPVAEYLPNRIKQAVSGNGHASKIQIQHMVKTLLGLKEMPAPDGADALAVAICHAQTPARLRKSSDLDQPASRTKKKTWAGLLAAGAIKKAIA